MKKSIVFIIILLDENCNDNSCMDGLPDCAEYTIAACNAPYRTWAYTNCAKFCGFCRKSFSNQYSRMIYFIIFTSLKSLTKCSYLSNLYINYQIHR